MSLKIKYMFVFYGKLSKHLCHWVSQEGSRVRMPRKEHTSKRKNRVKVFS